MPHRKTSITVMAEADIADFDDDILLDEITHRRIGIHTQCEDLITEIWQLRRTDKNYDAVVDKLIYAVLGKVV